MFMPKYIRKRFSCLLITGYKVTRNFRNISADIFSFEGKIISGSVKKTSSGIVVYSIENSIERIEQSRKTSEFVLICLE